MEVCKPNDSASILGTLQLIMQNHGKPPHSRVVASKQTEQRFGGQPGQKKVIHSNPIDFTRVQQTNNPVIESLYSTNPVTSVRSGQVLMSTVTSEARSHIMEPPAGQRPSEMTQKQMRVERAKKLVAGSTAMKSAVDDPLQPEWVKVRSLQEIETIRDATKSQVVTQQFLNKTSSNKFKCDVIQGSVSFVRIAVANRSRDTDMFNV